MKTTVRIVDYGRGPQIEGHRLTVMDVFYYLRRGRDFEFIHRAMPSLNRDEFDAVVEYVKDHYDELIEKDDRVEERNRQGIAEQKAKGLGSRLDGIETAEERRAFLLAELRRQQALKSRTPTVTTLLVDGNIDGHAGLLLKRLASEDWKLFADHLGLQFLYLKDVGLEQGKP